MLLKCFPIVYKEVDALNIFNKIVKRDFKNLAIAIGCFDGIHKGHQKVISQAVKCKSLGLVPAVFTFSKSPKSIILKQQEKRIISQEEKYKLLEELGIEEVYNIDFNYIRSYLAENFVRDLLINTLGTKYIICGFNFRFGLNGSAGTKELIKLCSTYNVKLKVVSPVEYKNMPISSTRIKKSIESGDYLDADNMLGRVHVMGK